jgi:hypothetical protein
MNIAEIIKKVLAGEELSAAEKEYLGKADFNDANRIPKARLDQEIEKRKAAEATATELQSKLDELTTKVDELENKGLSEVEKAKKESEKAIAQLKSEVSTLSKERDNSAAALKALERKGQIRDLAAKHNFANSEYLDFLTTSRNLDISNEQATAGFFQELEKSSPELFRSTAKPGGGTVGTGQTGSGTVAAETRIKELLNKPELSSREASEVIKLQSEINSATPDKSGGSTGQEGNK